MCTVVRLTNRKMMWTTKVLRMWWVKLRLGIFASSAGLGPSAVDGSSEAIIHTRYSAVHNINRN